MSTTKLFNIFALSTLAIILCSFAPSQTLALTVQGNHLARQVPNHHGIARKKRGKRGTQCKPRSTTSPASTPASQPTSTPQSSPSPSPSPSSTQPPNTVSTPSTLSNTGGKLCIAWALGDDPRLATITNGHRIKCILLWVSTMTPNVRNSGIPVSIMLWSADQGKIDQFNQDVQAGGFSDVRYLNEPNEGGQANMSPEAAVQPFRDHILPLKGKGFTITCPATSSNPNGFDWVKQWASECPECIAACDWSGVHFYDDTFEKLKAYVEKWVQGFSKPYQLTEFACQNFNGGAQPSMDQIWAFTVAAVDYLNNDPNAYSYAPFGFMDDLYNVNPENKLLNVDGSLTALGQYYVDHS